MAPLWIPRASRCLGSGWVVHPVALFADVMGSWYLMYWVPAGKDMPRAASPDRLRTLGDPGQVCAWGRSG